MTILYSGTGRFEDAAEIEEFNKQRFAKEMTRSINISDAMTCIGPGLKKGWYALRPRNSDEPQPGKMATNESLS